MKELNKGRFMSKYGDIDNVRNDVKTLNDILDRQGNSLVLDVIAEKIGNIALRFDLSCEDVVTLTNQLTNELKEAINERT